MEDSDEDEKYTVQWAARAKRNDSSINDVERSHFTRVAKKNFFIRFLEMTF